MKSSYPLKVPAEACCSRFLNVPVRSPSTLMMLNDWSNSSWKLSRSVMSRDPRRVRSPWMFS